MALKTPVYDLKNFVNVYEPREDSYLFLDALEKDFAAIKCMKPTFVLEVGSGSGIIISALASVLSTCVCFSSDINVDACLATQKTAALNNVSIEICNMDLFRNFKNNSFDIVLFNPPYVVTDMEELNGNGLNRAWAGGDRGRVIIDKFLNDLHRILNVNGICYVVLLKENNPEEIMNEMSLIGFRAEILLERKIPGEHLFVVKLFKL